MTLRALRWHLMTLIWTAAGIAGFGLVYDGFSDSMPAYIYTGIPLLLMSLWWVGRDLGRSNLAARRRRLLKARRLAEQPKQI